MTSMHSYFYQADAAADITDLAIESNLDDLNLSAIVSKIGRDSKKGTSSKQPGQDLRNITISASEKNLKVKAKGA